MIRELFKKRSFDINADRLGPDCPFTHWKLFFKNSMKSICKKKFGYFSDTSEFRPGAYAITCSKIYLGNRVIIRPGTMLFAYPDLTENGSITIADNVMLGSGVHIYTANHRYDIKELDFIDQGHFSPKSVELKRGCWIGANAILLPGVVVGKNSIVGAGSVVTKSVPDNAIVAGNPSKIIRYLNC